MKFPQNFLFLILMLHLIPLSAQEHSCNLSGRIIDGKSKSPIGFAAVTLHSKKDSSVITGSLTDEQGLFTINGVAPGLYRLKVKYMGYQTYVKDSVSISSQQTNYHCNDILLKASGKDLTGITITAEQSTFQQGIDKKVFEVDKDLSSIGGSAADVLKNIPSVLVDVEGNVSFRGNGNITVWIDGHPSGMIASNQSAIFDQIPASSIERIELITNPSAKYDPDGVSGIINIVLKKNKAKGFNITSSISYSTWLKGNAFLNAGYRKGKLNTFVNYSYRYVQRSYNGYTNRTNYLTNSSFSSDQTSSGVITSQTHMVKGGLDYDWNSRNSCSLTGTLNMDLTSDTDHVRYTWFDMNQQTTQYAHRDMFGRDPDQGYDIYGTYRHSFDDPARKFTFEFSLSGNNNHGKDSIYQLSYNANGTYSIPFPVLQETDNRWMLRNYFVKADWMQPLAKSGVLETGVKYNARFIDDNLGSQEYNYPIAAFQNDTGISNRFQYTEQVYAGYAMYSKSMGKLSTQLGARVEYTDRDVMLYNSPPGYEKKYADLFPSGYLGYKPAEGQEWRLGYSRRINRPNGALLNPFPDYTDPLNLRYGNPNLNPEYIDSYELAWMGYFKKITLDATAYYRYARGTVQVFKTLTDTVTGASVSTYRNIGSSETYGFEVTGKADLYSWWSVILNGNLFELQLNGDDQLQTQQKNGLTGSVKCTSRMNITPTTSFQLSGLYHGPAPNTQGYALEYYFVDAGIRQELMHGKASLGFTLADVFNSLISRINTETVQFSQEYLKKKESRIATVNFIYRFGTLSEGKKQKAVELPAAQPEIE
jgi:iron complex outermembrane receptor protein